MGDEEALLAAIVAAPEDEAPRLVYADWLEERGQAERAEFIHVQSAFDAAEATDPTYAELEAREWELRAAVGEDWLDRLDGVGGRAYRALWARSARAHACLDNPAGRQRARRSARNLMRRARRNVLFLVARLTAAGYRFVDLTRAYCPPARRDLAAIAEFGRETGWTLPVSLAAFHREVGSVNLMGAHPDWPNPAYFFPDTAWVLGGPQHWYTDPLVIEINPEYTLADLREEVTAGAERLRLEFAPDLHHKANVSGAGGEGVDFGRRSMDGTSTVDGQPFVEFLRMAFRWAGFPGFRHIEGAPQAFILGLQQGQLPI